MRVNYEGWTWMNKVYGFREVWTTGVVGTWTKKPSFVTKTKNPPQSHTHHQTTKPQSFVTQKQKPITVTVIDMIITMKVSMRIE